MESLPDQTEMLEAIRKALIAGTDVEDMLEPVIRRLPDKGDATALGAKLRVLLQAEPARGGAEGIRRIADRLDKFAVELVATASVIEDDELTAVSEQARDWGRALWESETGADHIYNQLRHALVELCRHRASLLTGREISTLR